MPDNGQFPDEGFEKRFEDLGAHVEYPPTPDLAATVRERIEEENRQRPGVTGWVAAAVVVLLILPVLVGLVMSGGGMGGSASGGGVGGGGAVGSSGQSGGSDSTSEQAASGAPEQTLMEDTEMLEETAFRGGSEGDLADSAVGSAVGSADGSTASLGGAFGFGELLPLKEARSREDPRLLVPTASGFERPDEVYAASGADDYVLVYRARDYSPALGETDIGLILTETDNDVGAFLENVPPNDLDRVAVAGERGYWSRDVVGTTPPPGTAVNLPGNVLIWERDGRVLWLQANIERDRAVSIAESVR